MKKIIFSDHVSYSGCWLSDIELDFIKVQSIWKNCDYVSCGTCMILWCINLLLTYNNYSINIYQTYTQLIFLWSLVNVLVKDISFDMIVYILTEISYIDL